MEIEHCAFPDDLLYEGDGLVWARDESGRLVVGITSIYAAVAGRLAKVTSKALGASYTRGAAIGFLESARHFGPIRTPVSGILEAVNETVLANPRTMGDSPYAHGWFARIRPSDWNRERTALRSGPDAKEDLAAQIAALRVRCFAAFPDHEMFEIGIECATVLVKLNELVARIEPGEVVHLVTDDPTSPIEMIRWSDETGQPVVDERKEGALFHYLVRKVR